MLQVATNRSIKNLLSVNKALQYFIVALHKGIVQQTCIGSSVEEFRGKSQTNAHFFHLKTERIIDLYFGGAHFARIVGEKCATKRKFVAHRAIVHQRVGAGLLWERSPGAAVVCQKLVLILKTSVPGIDQHRKSVVLRVNGLFLGKSGHRTEAKYECKEYLFHCKPSLWMMVEGKGWECDFFNVISFWQSEQSGMEKPRYILFRLLALLKRKLFQQVDGSFAGFIPLLAQIIEVTKG